MDRDKIRKQFTKSMRDYGRHSLIEGHKKRSTPSQKPTAPPSATPVAPPDERKRT